MTLLIELLAVIADLIYTVLHVFGDGDSIRGNWFTTFTSPVGGPCIEIYRFSEFSSRTLLFIQQYRAPHGDNPGTIRTFVGQGVRHGDLVYAYYTSSTSTEERAGVMILQRSTDPQTLEALVRNQYWESYPLAGSVKEIRDEASLKRVNCTFRQKLLLTRSKPLFNDYADAYKGLHPSR